MSFDFPQVFASIMDGYNRIGFWGDVDQDGIGLEFVIDTKVFYLDHRSTVNLFLMLKTKEDELNSHDKSWKPSKQFSEEFFNNEPERKTKKKARKKS